MKKITKKNIVAIIITVVLVVILISQINLSDIYLIVNNLRPVYFVFAFLIFLLSQFLRAIRFKILINRPVTLLSLFKVTSLGIMANQLLPARTGEVSYLYLFRKVYGLSLGRSASILISARILDLLTIIVLFLLSLFLLVETQETKMKIFILGVVILVVVILILSLLLFAASKILKLIKKIMILINLQNYRFSNYSYNVLQSIISNLSVIKSLKVFLPSVLFSFFIWLAMYFLTYVLVRGLGLELSFFEGVFVATFALITSILPIHGLVGFGTTEGFWAIGMLLLGYSKGLAISSGFGIHVIILFFSLITALFSFLTIEFKK
jgi:hypothetical protein